MILDLTDNQLTKLPLQIGQLAKLTKLFLAGNRLTELPSQMNQLTNLTLLDFRRNQLITLPLEINQLINLIELYLNNNNLTTLSPEIGHLINLKTLGLSFNKLTMLPPEIGHLSNLIELHLQNNKLTMLPSEIGHLSNLVTLDLSNNRLVNIPCEIGQLINLTQLDLNDNQLTALPFEISRLSNLKKLYLYGNQLTTLPLEITQLSKLNLLDLRDNPLPIPSEILVKTKEPTTIINYYLQHITNQRHPLNEAKLLLVGQGSVGKTSLVQRLIENCFNPAENKTEGIAIRQWLVSINDQQIRLNVWDFGGQEIMHATHQFFLTKRSLYLLVIDARLGEKENRLEEWLKLIGSFGGESPVIVVGNKIDQQPLDLDKRGLMLKYPHIRAIIETSCLDGRGLAELRTAIERQIAGLPHVRDELLQSWFNVKTRLEGVDRDYLPYYEYLSICQTEGIADDLSQRTLIGFLHDLGVVLNFQDDPRLEETNILNPEWVTQGVYKILNNHALMTEHGGVLKREFLSQILDPARYPRDKHLFIVDMMRKFELCFDFEGFADRKFLIPDLLPKEEPASGDWSNSLAFQYHYDVLPGSVISRFIVRMNHLIHQNTYWRNGVVLAYEDGVSNRPYRYAARKPVRSSEGNLALIKADREEKKIFIWVSGPEAGRRRFLAIIRAEFEAIHRTIPGLEVAEKVPLPGHPEIVVDYQDLRGLEEMGEDLVVPSLRQRFSVKKLLDGVDELIRRTESRNHSRDNEESLSAVENIKRRLIQYHRRLQKLKEEEALKGKSPGLLLEIEDIEEDIKKLQTELKEIE
ncbi:MAG: COR domain-containing protein [Anaerolineae bacterium]